MRFFRHGRRGAWENEPHGGPSSDRCRNIELTSAVRDEAFYHPESEAGSVTRRLGREEGGCGALHDLRRHAGACIRYGDLDGLAAIEPVALVCARANDDAPAIGHRIGGVPDQIEQGEFQLAWIEANG